MKDPDVTVVKVPLFYGRDFFNQVFRAAKDHGVPVVFVNGSVRTYRCEGGGATINIVDRLFGWRGSK
jgi:hypothetical protein